MLLAALSLFLVFSPATQPLRNAVFDRYQRILPLERTTHPVTIVAIDEDSIAQFGQWPWPRDRVAELVERIGAAGAASIGLDLVFAEPDRLSPEVLAREVRGLAPELRRALEALPSHDARLARAIAANPVVLGLSGDLNTPNPERPRVSPVRVSGDAAGELDEFASYTGSMRAFAEAAHGQGLINSGPEDQVVRVVPYVARVMGEVVPSLGVEALRVGVDRGLRLAEGPSWEEITVQVADYAARVRDDGKAWLRMGPHDPSRFVSAVEVFKGSVDPEKLQDKVVLVGIYTTGTDFKTTPLAEFVPGVEIHAQVAENLFNGVSLRRPGWARWAEGLALAACGILLISWVPRTSALRGIQAAFAMIAALAVAAFIAFARFDILLDFAWPAIGTFAVFLAVVVGTLSEAERQRRLLREQAARMAGEVDAARRIQMGLLPDPNDLGDGRDFRIAALLEPARTVGGDFYDCFMVDERRLFVLVADVSGKGLPAALFMASAKSHLKSAALRGDGDVGAILGEAQREIQRENPEQLFVTAFALVLDVPTGRVAFSSAGHEPPFACRPGSPPERLEAAGGPPLCVIDGFAYPRAERALVPGEWICIVTDGATEAMNPRREFFGVERLRGVIASMSADAEPDDVVRRVRREVTRFADGAEAADDLTLLVLRWEGAGA